MNRTEQNRTDTLIYFSQGDPFSIFLQNKILLSMETLAIKVQIHGIEELKSKELNIINSQTCTNKIIIKNYTTKITILGNYYKWRCHCNKMTS